jgi:pimeloyl-ACP methyl ester carboxylesterase
VIPPCAPHYSFQLTTADSDDADIDATVDYIRQLRRVDKVSLIGWSVGGPRAGTYAARHPDKVDRLLLYSPVYNRAEADRPGGRMPEQGVPLSVRSLAGFSNNWDTQIGCSNQFEPAIRNVITSEIARLDPVARDWGEGLFRAPVLNPHWGWNAAAAMQIQAPTLLIRGMLDTQIPETADRDLFSDLGIREKVFARVACASHFMLWETPHTILHRYSIEWLRDGTFAGEHSGAFVVDTQGLVKLE